MGEADTRPADARVCLLGPVAIWGNGRIKPLRSERQRCLLAVLASRANQTVSADTLIHALWGDEAPPSARHALQVHVSGLRRTLQPTGLRLSTRPPGYVLSLADDQLDAFEFERLAATGRACLASGDEFGALQALERGLDLWRGSPMVDVPWERFAEAEVRRLEEMCRVVAEDRLDAVLALGRDAVAEAEALVAAEPLRERRWRQLLLAMYRSGRQVEALRRAHEVRSIFLEEFGVEPGEELRRLEQQILEQDPALWKGLAPSAASDAPAEMPSTQFVRIEGVHIAFQTSGHGRHSLLVVPSFSSHIEAQWGQPPMRAFRRRLSRSTRLTVIDRVGSGLSDRSIEPVGAAQQVPHVVGVLDHLAIGRTVLFGLFDGGALALLTAAMCPDRVAAVVTYAACPAPTADDFPGAFEPEVIEAAGLAIAQGLDMKRLVKSMAPSRADDASYIRSMSRLVQMGASVGDTLRLADAMLQVDVRDRLSDVVCPVLLMHRVGDRIVPSVNAEWLEEQLPRGRAVMLPGDDSFLAAGDLDRMADEIEGFLANLG